MNQSDIRNILPWQSENIKRVTYHNNFLLAALTDSVPVAGSMAIEDNNIIPVLLRTTLQFPIATMGAPPQIPDGVTAAYRVWMDNDDNDILLETWCMMSSQGSPLFQREFYGSARDVLSDFNILEFEGRVIIGGSTQYTANVNGLIFLEFYYIPIRY